MAAIKMICKMVSKVLCRIYGYDIISKNLRGGTRKVGKQERNRRKNEGERAGKKIKWSLVKATRPFSFQKYKGESGKSD